tara:strand:+ start:541 stop:1143 length:603 start_codon:yes stop_codon:yes gene_type:complete
MKYISTAILALIFLVSCSERENEKVTEYKETGHLIKQLEEIDIDTYQQYINERMYLETKYLSKMNQQQKRKSEYQLVKEEFDSSFRDHIEYADRRVPELNIAIEKIEDQLRVVNNNLNEWIQDLNSLNQDPSSDDFVSELRSEIKSLEKTAADLMRKRVDLFLQFRKYELSQEDPAIQSELNAILKEAELATKKASQNLN